MAFLLISAGLCVTFVACSMGCPPIVLKVLFCLFKFLFILAHLITVLVLKGRCNRKTFFLSTTKTLLRRCINIVVHYFSSYLSLATKKQHSFKPMLGALPANPHNVSIARSNNIHLTIGQKSQNSTTTKTFYSLFKAYKCSSSIDHSLGKSILGHRGLLQDCAGVLEALWVGLVSNIPPPFFCCTGVLPVQNEFVIILYPCLTR